MRTVLFDLDGTLTDPRPGFVRSIRHALDRLRVACPDDDVLASFIGPPLRGTLATLLGTADRRPIEIGLRVLEVAVARQRSDIPGLLTATSQTLEWLTEVRWNRLPSVIRLLEYRRIPHQSRALSRKNILLRDRNTCQYCGVILPASELTLDHVVPRSRGGSSTWENLVACCHTCNRRKGNSLLHEMPNMKLLREPRAFNLHTSRHIMRMIGRSDAKWRKYLFY